MSVSVGASVGDSVGESVGGWSVCPRRMNLCNERKEKRKVRICVSMVCICCATMLLSLDTVPISSVYKLPKGDGNEVCCSKECDDVSLAEGRGGM